MRSVPTGNPHPRRQSTPVSSVLELEIVQSESGSAELAGEVLALCNLAYGENLSHLFQSFGASTHVVGTCEGRLVTHAMWVTRWLQPGAAKPLETAYVEMVATHPQYRRRGLASLAMRRLVDAIPQSCGLAALCPATPALYARLGWRFWQAPLRIRLAGARFLDTPEERVMVLALPGRPRLDLDAPLSAEWREGELW